MPPEANWVDSFTFSQIARKRRRRSQSGYLSCFQAITSNKRPQNGDQPRMGDFSRIWAISLGCSSVLPFPSLPVLARLSPRVTACRSTVALAPSSVGDVRFSEPKSTSEAGMFMKTRALKICPREAQRDGKVPNSQPAAGTHAGAQSLLTPRYRRRRFGQLGPKPDSGPAARVGASFASRCKYVACPRFEWSESCF